MANINNPLPLATAEPFDADYPYRLSERGYDKLLQAKHLLALMADLSIVENAACPHVTVRRESLAETALLLHDLLDSL